MLLHNEKELFREIVLSAAEELGMAVAIVEKDYYVTMLLRELAKDCPECVFKGGTSLSKCYHVIDRFSEDIDITFCGRLSQGERRHLKNDTIAGISRFLGMPIVDWELARSGRDYNCYTFSYCPLEHLEVENRLSQGVKMEISLVSQAFPVIKLPVGSYVGQYLQQNHSEIADQYGLIPFDMNVQQLERTLADKVFALCDYYLQGKTKRYSRHMYDVYMLLPHVAFDESFRQLVMQVRAHRAATNICPSAVSGVDIPELLNQIIENDVYRKDYADITTYFQNHPVSYEQALEAIRTVAGSGMFA